MLKAEKLYFGFGDLGYEFFTYIGKLLGEIGH